MNLDLSKITILTNCRQADQEDLLNLEKIYSDLEKLVIDIELSLKRLPLALRNTETEIAHLSCGNLKYRINAVKNDFKREYIENGSSEGCS